MSSVLTRYLPFSPSTTPLQAATYLLAVCLFSISFLVFLNSSVSFVITDLIGVKHGVGDMVGTLGFADELVALVACPVWGIVSDRLGVRWVCFLGYCIVAVALALFVQARNVYPQLLLARLCFSVGGAATATMVTAILPSMTGGQRDRSSQAPAQSNRLSAASVANNSRYSVTPSLDSEITITPERFIHNGGISSRGAGRGRGFRKSSLYTRVKGASPPRLAGLVGLFTGCGALLALVVFLPLPAQFSQLKGVTQGQAVADSFYVVAVVALLVSVVCFIGLRNLHGEEAKGWRLLLGRPGASPSHDHSSTTTQTHTPFLPYWRLLLDATALGFQNHQIGLGYLGGFVARASSVAISLFIPLSVNAYFISHGFCHSSPNDPSGDIKKECRAAYVLAAELTGVSQLVALLCAPLFGYLSDRYHKFNIPLLTASAAGIVGYVAFAELKSPEAKNVDERGGSPAVFLWVSLIGISQIGAIVCSLGLLGRGVLGEGGGYNLSAQLARGGDSSAQAVSAAVAVSEAPETAPLLDGTAETQNTTTTPPPAEDANSLSHLKGSIAGVYSLFGGAAILLLTKLGGYLFDSVSGGAPFYMMAVFNAILLVVGVGVVVWREIAARGRSHLS